MKLLPSRKTVRSGYSLIELLVVMAVLAILGALSIPSAFGQNDRYLLDNSAQQIRQFLIQAKDKATSASTQDSIAGTAQYYQVTMGEYSSYGSPDQIADNTAFGDTSTNSITLDKGMLECNNLTNEMSGRTVLDSLKLPKNVYLASFFPYQINGTGASPMQSFIRFVIGKTGYKCGGVGDYVIDSTVDHMESGYLVDPWNGIDSRFAGSTQANNLYIEVKSSKINESRYVVVDRLTSQISVTKTKPDEFFQSVQDVYLPKWDVGNDKKISVACGNRSSHISLSFTRARDYISDTEVDENRPIYYTINWSTDGTTYQPLVVNYYWNKADHSGDYVVYNFDTDLIKSDQRPASLNFQITAYDPNGNASDPVRTLTFAQGTTEIWSCSAGNGVGGDTLPGQAVSPSHPENNHNNGEVTGHEVGAPPP